MLVPVWAVKEHTVVALLCLGKQELQDDNSAPHLGTLCAHLCPPASNSSWAFKKSIWQCLYIFYPEDNIKKIIRASLVAQWLRIRLPMQWTQV